MSEVRYRIVPTKLQRDPAWRGLDASGRYVALTVFTNRQLGRVPVSLFSVRAAASDAMLPDREYLKAFRAVVRAFGWAYDDDSEHLYIPDWFTFNPPQDTSHLTAILRDLNELAPSPLIDRFAVEAGATLATPCLQRAFADGVATRGLPRGDTRGAIRGGARVPTRDGCQELELDHELDLEHEHARPAQSSPLLVVDDHFETFWASYPNKVGKDDARKAWQKRRADLPPFDEVLTSLKRQCASVRWTKENGQYIPNPSTWINQGRWKDVPAEPASSPISEITRQNLNNMPEAIRLIEENEHARQR